MMLDIQIRNRTVSLGFLRAGGECAGVTTRVLVPGPRAELCGLGEALATFPIHEGGTKRESLLHRLGLGPRGGVGGWNHSGTAEIRVSQAFSGGRW